MVCLRLACIHARGHTLLIVCARCAKTEWATWFLATRHLENCSSGYCQRCRMKVAANVPHVLIQVHVRIVRCETSTLAARTLLSRSGSRMCLTKVGAHLNPRSTGKIVPTTSLCPDFAVPSNRGAPEATTYEITCSLNRVHLHTVSFTGEQP